MIESAQLAAATSVVQSPFAVRRTGLPVSAVAALSSPALMAAVRAALAAERWIAGEGRALADALHVVIGALAGAQARPGLVGLRRSLFGGRRPRTAEWSVAVRSALPADLRLRIEHWIRRLAERDRLQASVEGTLAAETERTVTALRETANDPMFRHGLVLSSRALSTEVEKWLGGHAGGPTGSRTGQRRSRTPARQAIVRLARYLSRAATKTSPYSTFTTLGAGVWTDAEAPALAIGPFPRPHGLLELNGGVLAELASVLSTSDDLRPAMLVRTNPSLTRLGDRLLALGPAPRERIASIAALPEVSAVLDALGSGWLTLDRLRAELAGNVPLLGKVAWEKVVAFVDRLIELGVIELRLPVDDQCRDWFGAVAAWLYLQGSRRWTGTARACVRLSQLLHEPIELAEVAGYSSRLAQIREAVEALRAAAGLAVDHGEQSAALYEYAAYAEPVAAASRPRWHLVVADLDRVRRWLAPHDPALPMRIALGAYTGARFGPGARVAFLTFYRALMADLDQYRVAADHAAPGLAGQTGLQDALADLSTELRPGESTLGYRLPALRELVSHRDQALRAIVETAPDADGVVRVDLDHVPGPASGLLPDPPAARSVAWFVQPDGNRLVLNAAMTGHGRGRLRPLHLIAEAAGAALPAALLPSRSDADDVVADSSGVFGHTLNLRWPGGGHELDYPFTVRLTEHRPRIPLRDLVVEHDAATSLIRLRDTGNGAVVTPVHTGMLVQSGLPRALQLLTRGLGANPGWLFRPELLSSAERARVDTGSGEVGFAPRIEAGLVVLRRATWIAAARVVPRPAAGEPAASALLRLHRWLDAHGVPQRSFVTASPPPGSPEPVIAKARKPLYVDFASPWLLEVFERLIAGADTVRFSEVLPALNAYPDGHVTELVLETTAGSP